MYSGCINLLDGPVTDDLHANLFDVIAQVFTHKGLVVGDAPAPIGGDGAQFGRIDGGMDDEMGDPGLE